MEQAGIMGSKVRSSLPMTPSNTTCGTVHSLSGAAWSRRAIDQERSRSCSKVDRESGVARFPQNRPVLQLFGDSVVPPLAMRAAIAVESREALHQPVP